MESRFAKYVSEEPESRFAKYLETEPSAPTASPRPVARDDVPPEPVARRGDRKRRRDAVRTVPEPRERQPVKDIGRRAARGATEVVASVPEAAAVATANALTPEQAEVLRAEGRAQQISKLLMDDTLSPDRRAQLESQLSREQEVVGRGMPATPDVQDRPLYQAGQAVRDASQRVFGAPDPQFDDRFGSKLAEGAGNMAGFIATTLLTGPLGGAAAGSALNTSAMYRDAINGGATEEEAKKAARIGALVGTSEALPISRAFGLLPSAVRQRAASALGRRLTNAFASAGEEGVQEAMQSIANEMTHRGVWDPERKVITAETGEEALIGAILGGGMGAVAPTPQASAQAAPAVPVLSPSDLASPLPNDVIAMGKKAQQDLLSAPREAPVLQEPEAESPLAPEKAAKAPAPEVGTTTVKIKSPETGEEVEISGPIEEVERIVQMPRPQQPDKDALPQQIPQTAEVEAQTEIEAPQSPQETVNRFAKYRPQPVERKAAPEAPKAPEADAPPEVFDPGRPGLQAASEWRAEQPDLPQVDDMPVLDKNGWTGEVFRRNRDTGEMEVVRLTDTPDAAPVAAEPAERTQVSEEPVAQEAPEADPSPETVEQVEDADLASRQAPRAVEVLENEDLTNIETDAETFQYKSGGDADGVTDRLLNVRNWDTARAGSAIIYEYADGRRVVADGHQRLGLAKRMREQGQDVSMPVIIRREMDGYTPEEVMTEAALKNIAESNVKGTPDPQQVVDAGKVIRSMSDEGIREMDLPPSSALARQAKDVSRLSDDAFGMLVNERATVRNAAAVGRTVEDKAVHADVLRVMDKLPIRNAFEAEQVAKQAAAETQVSTQASLFGEEQVAETLYLERARVMDTAVRRLRKDRATFNTLLKRGNLIADAGNTLDQDANKKRVAEDAAVQEFLTRQANSKGPISDALSEAARDVKGGADLGQTVTRFVKTVRGAIQSDFGAGQGIEGNWRTDEPARPTEERAAPLEAERQDYAYENPLGPDAASSTPEGPNQGGAPGSETSAAPGIDQPIEALDNDGLEVGLLTEQTPEGEQYLIPGAEQSPERSEAAREADRRREMDARAMQSRMSTTAPQDDAGPLFDDQPDLLDRKEQAAAVAYGHAPAKRTAGNFREVREAVKSFQGQTLVNRDSGIEAVLSRKTLDKMLSSSAVNRSESTNSHKLAVANVDSLFENAVHGWSKPDGRGEPTMRAIHRMFARMNEADGSASFVKLTVKETVSDAQNNPLYSVESVEFLPEGVSAATWANEAAAADGIELRNTLSAETINNIAASVEADNAARLKSAPRVKEDLIAAGMKRAKELHIPNVTFDIDPDMEARGAVEITRDKVAKVIFGTTLNGEHTTNHEVIHIFRAMGLFKDKEWAALEKEARRIWAKRYNVAEAYSDLDEAGQIEEAIAEAFADYILNDKKPATSALQNVFAKMKRFFRAMKDTLSGQGITRVEDIFDRVDEGQVGARGEGIALDAVRKEQRPAAAMRQMSPEGLQQVADQTDTVALPPETRFERFRRVTQDRMIALRRMEEATAENRGLDEIDKRESVYFAEERYTGRTGHALNELDDQFVKPMIEAIAKEDITIKGPDGAEHKSNDAVALWLMARHAKERNKYVASINDSMPDGGSGLTNAEADAILAQGKPHQKMLDEISAKVDKLRDEMIDLRERAGLISAQEAMVWRSMFKHYVPLREFADGEMFDGMIGGNSGPGVGRKFNVRGQETKRAMGRSSLAFDPLSTLLADAQATIVRAEKNIVGQTMLKYAQKYENPALYEISDVEEQLYFDKDTGKVEKRNVSPTARPLGDNEMSVKVGGKEHRITFKDPRLAHALGQVGVEQLGDITKAMSMVHRYFSAVYTMLSPTFVITNALRDGMAASVNLGAFGGKDAGKLRAAAMNPKKWMQAFAGVKRGLNGKADTEYSKWFKEYSEAGGKVHFWNIENPGEASIDFGKRVKMETGGKARRMLKKLGKLNTRDNPILGGIENVNLAVDNAVRLSTYVKARELGWTKEDAASLAKNLTVNFNRRGEWGSQLNAFILFFNAAMQGTQVTLKAMKAPAVKKAVGGMILAGFFGDLLAAMRSEEDDDGELEYDQIPDYKSQRAFIVPYPLGDEGYITIPLPYGYNVFFHAGQQAGKVFRQVKDPKEAAGEVFMTALEAFSPISGRDPLDFVLPQPARIARDFIENEDAFGRPIRPEYPYADWGPQAYMEYDGATTMATKTARGLNRATGGSSTESGLIDISPEYIDHAFKSAFGGMGKFGVNVAKGVERAATGNLVEETKSYEIPLLRVLYTTSDDYLNGSRYHEFRQEVEEANAMVKRARAGEDDRQLRDITPEQQRLARLYQQLLLTKRRLKKLKEKTDPIYANDRLSDRERQRLLKPHLEQRNKYYMQFNKAFIDRMGPQAE